VIAPDYPGFGHTQAPPGFTYSFDRLADVLDGFAANLGLDRFVMYVFDFGGPVGFRLAARHPERIAGLIVQNANAYHEGLSPLARQMIANRPGVPGAEGNVRRILELPVTRGQYEEGTRSPELISPDGWTLDQHLLDQPGRKDAQIAPGAGLPQQRRALPGLAAVAREHQPPALIVWGRNDAFFPEPGPAPTYTTSSMPRSTSSTPATSPSKKTSQRSPRSSPRSSTRPTPPIRTRLPIFTVLSDGMAVCGVRSLCHEGGWGCWRP
jgi:pimeloyl-ACP methyl ester carboxylesterase